MTNLIAYYQDLRQTPPLYEVYTAEDEWLPVTVDMYREMMTRRKHGNADLSTGSNDAMAEGSAVAE